MLLEILSHVVSMAFWPAIFAGPIVGLLIYLCNSWEKYGIPKHKNILWSMIVGVVASPLITVLSISTFAMLSVFAG